MIHIISSIIIIISNSRARRLLSGRFRAIVAINTLLLGADKEGRGLLDIAERLLRYLEVKVARKEEEQEEEVKEAGEG